MNKQHKSLAQGGIEWTDYTWNPVGGCQHACRWQMPDGSVARCYAETVAERLATSAYPHGFAHHYWRPEALQAPLKLGTPAKIFLDSMSDLMGKWIPDEQVEAVLDICRQAHWHTFQLLTKNAPRLLQFTFPPNVWIGVSAPPSWMLGKQLTTDQQRRMVERQCEVLAQVNVPVRWMSIEPLSFDIAPLLKGAPLEWAVIGAATNGRKTYQPRAEWIENLLELFDQQGVKVFFKGNLAWQPWREEFPALPAQATPQELQALGKRAEQSIEALLAELDRCDKMQRVLSNVLLIAKAAPSRVKNAEQVQRDLAALRERQAELQAQLDSLTARRAEPNASVTSVTSGEQAEQAEPMQASAHDAPSAPSVAPAQTEQAAPSLSVTTARAETAKTRVSPATLARAIALDHTIAALESRLAELRAERAKLLSALEASAPRASVEPSAEPRAPKPKPSACEALGRRKSPW